MECYGVSKGPVGIDVYFSFLTGAGEPEPEREAEQRHSSGQQEKKCNPPHRCHGNTRTQFDRFHSCSLKQTLGFFPMTILIALLFAVQNRRETGSAGYMCG